MNQGSSLQLKARILRIIRGTTVDGPGFRTSIYFAGCAHACQGCHNPESWRFDAGDEMTLDELLEIVDEEDFDVTLSGGDPLYQPVFVSHLCERIRALGHNVWIYTGFKWEEIVASPSLLDAVDDAKVVVDSPFDYSLKNKDLRFRGSSNQRIIDVPASLQTGDVVLLMQ